MGNPQASTKHRKTVKATRENFEKNGFEKVLKLYFF